MLSGGHLEDVPQPHRRKFPGEELRKVRVQVSVYDLVGGHHYWVSLHEEDNPIWDSRTCEETGWPGGDETIGWRAAWDDEEGKGRVIMSSPFDFQWQVTNFIQEKAEEFFPLETHVLASAYVGEVKRMEGRYYYQREGD